MHRISRLDSTFTESPEVYSRYAIDFHFDTVSYDVGIANRDDPSVDRSLYCGVGFRSDAEKIKGRSSGDVLLILGYTGRTEMIHRDDLVLGGE